MNWLRCIALTLIVLAGCGKNQQPAAEKPLIFWHGQSDQKAQVLRDIIRRYNESHPPLPVQEEFIGNYDTLYKKTMTALRAKSPPDLATTYESMVSDYMKYYGVVDLAPYLEKDAKTSDVLRDIYPSLLESNRYENFDGKLLSMPFTKSILMLYYNVDMLAQIGKDQPPATWDEFLADCRAIKKKRPEVSPLAMVRDASTFDAMVFSFGGEVCDAKARRPLFDRPAALAALVLNRDLFREGLAHEVAFGSYDDRNDFADQHSMFFIRSSTSRPYVSDLVKNKFKWNITVIPRGGAAKSPRTVLFGMNISVFPSTPERQAAAWQFIRYFLSTQITADWATKTGYLPVRKSALEVPLLKTFLQQHPANRRAIDAISYAEAEPKVAGWQEVRAVMEKVLADVFNQRLTPEQAAATLQKEAQRVLNGR